MHIKDDPDFIQDDHGRFNGSRGHGGSGASSSSGGAKPAGGKPRAKETPEEAAARSARVMGKLPKVGAALPKLRDQYEKDLALSDAQKDRVAAAVVKLMDTTTMRVGSEKYAKANGTLGASSLRKSNVSVDGDTVKIDFKGKAGVQWHREIKDGALASAISHFQSLPGDKLMQFHDAKGNVKPFDESDARDYMASHGITPKNLRTYHATENAARLLHEAGPPKSEAEAKKTISDVCKKTAELLGNTPAVCRSNYINPAVLRDWAGSFADSAAKSAWNFQTYLRGLAMRVEQHHIEDSDPFPEDAPDMSHVDDDAGESEPDKEKETAVSETKTSEDVLVNFGSAIKSDENDPYKGGCWLVIHSSADDPDLQGDFFDGGTDYGSHKTSDLYWAHGLDKDVQKERIGTASLTYEGKGVWMDYQLAKAKDSGYTAKAKKYAKEIAEAKPEQKAQIGASSGTIAHLVIREPIRDERGELKANRIAKWPLGGDASLTTMPCEPRTRPDVQATVQSIKSLPETSLKALMESEATQVAEDAPLADSTLPDYTYSKTPMLGHSLTSKMATEHAKTLTSLYRNRTLSTPEYAHVEGGCLKCLKDLHEGMDDGVSERPVEDWDDFSISYKAAGPGMKTVGDALYGAMTRAFNAGADTAHNRGYLTRDEHRDLRDVFEKSRDEYLDSLDASVRDRALKENGSQYLDIKQFPAERKSLGLTLSQEVESVLDGGSTVKAQAAELATRYSEIKTIRKAKGGDLGAKACADIEEVASGLKAAADALLTLLPNAQSGGLESVDTSEAKALLASLS